MRPQRLLLVVSVLYLARMAVAFVHGHAHDKLAVPLELWQDAFVWGVIVIGPTLALAWLWYRPAAPVAWLLAALLVAGWVFGLVFHFGPPNPDHVASMPRMPGRELFIVTAVALAIVEPLVAAAAAWLALSLGKTGERTHG